VACVGGKGKREGGERNSKKDYKKLSYGHARTQLISTTTNHHDLNREDGVCSVAP